MSTISQLKQKQSIPFKIVVIGSSGVGKSSLIFKYVKNIFSYDYNVTVGVENFSKFVQVNEKTTIRLQLWDTAGQQAYKSITRSLYKGVSGILLIYSIDKKQSFDQLNMWMNEIKQYSDPQSVIFLVGTKLDLQDVRKVTKQQGQNYMKGIQASSFIEVSAKTGQNIKELFDRFSKTLYKKYQSNSTFRNMVRPLALEKSPSFHLNKFTPKNVDEKGNNQNCC